MPVPAFEPSPPRARIGFGEALRRGFRRRCPACGQGKLFAGYLTMSGDCDRCGEPFEPCRADDAPAYFTILIVGHVLVPIVLLVEQWYQPAVALQMAIWLPLTLVSTLVALPFIKGATIAAVWATKRP